MNAKEDAVRQYFDRPLYLTSHRHAIKIRAMVVKELLGAVDDARIVDFGCGDGSLSIPLLSPKNSLTLVDLSEQMLELAASRIPEHCKSNVQITNAELTEFHPAAPFDVVICIGVLAHVKSVEEAIEKIVQCLKPGGQAVLELTPHDKPLGGLLCPHHAIRRAFAGNPLGYELNRMTIAQLIGIAARNGLEFVTRRRHSIALPTMRFWSDKWLFQFTLFTLRNPLLSRIGTEHILLFRKKTDSISTRDCRKRWRR
jgi:SAM-dependent methyltransferase